MSYPLVTCPKSYRDYFCSPIIPECCIALSSTSNFLNKWRKHGLAVMSTDSLGQTVSSGCVTL